MSSTAQETSSMSSTSNIQLIINALIEYAKITGIDLSQNQFAAKISRGNPKTDPRTRECIQVLSGSKSESHYLPQPGSECHPGVLRHSRRGGQPRKSHIPMMP